MTCRYPHTVLGTCCLPWREGKLDVALFERSIRNLVEAGLRDLYIFGTAGEGHTVTEAQFRQHWIGKVFRADTPSGPRIVYSAEAALDQVSHTPGAIAFVAAPVASRAVKVLKIDGKTPGQAGYRLR